MSLRPPVPYYGGKQNIAAAIAALFPDHDHYVEPFAGSLAVLLAKPPSRVETVNDIDSELVTFWRVLRDRPRELEEVCALTPHSRAEHERCFETATGDLEVARRVFVRLTQGRMARLTPTGWRNQITACGTATMATYLNGYRGRMPSTAARLLAVQIECRPAVDIIAKYGAAPDALLYVDPPYPAETRNGTNYRHEMPHRAEHEALSAALHGCEATVVLSGYACDLYDLELYAGWERHTIAATAGQGNLGANRTEVLWSNRSLGRPATLFDEAVSP